MSDMCAPEFWAHVDRCRPMQFAGSNPRIEFSLVKLQSEVPRLHTCICVRHRGGWALIRPLPDDATPPTTVRDGVSAGYYPYYEDLDAAVAYAVLT